MTDESPQMQMRPGQPCRGVRDTRIRRPRLLAITRARNTERAGRDQGARFSTRYLSSWSVARRTAPAFLDLPAEVETLPASIVAFEAPDATKARLATGTPLSGRW